jgi:hypothetical protein
VAFSTFLEQFAKIKFLQQLISSLLYMASVAFSPKNPDTYSWKRKPDMAKPELVAWLAQNSKLTLSEVALRHGAADHQTAKYPAKPKKRIAKAPSQSDHAGDQWRLDKNAGNYHRKRTPSQVDRSGGLFSPFRFLWFRQTPELAQISASPGSFSAAPLGLSVEPYEGTPAIQDGNCRHVTKTRHRCPLDPVIPIDPSQPLTTVTHTFW